MGVRTGFGKEAWMVSEMFIVEKGSRLGWMGRRRKK